MSAYILSEDAGLDLDDIWNTSPKTISTLPTAG